MEESKLNEPHKIIKLSLAVALIIFPNFDKIFYLFSIKNLNGSTRILSIFPCHSQFNAEPSSTKKEYQID